jgi:anthranilate phosphoribosyltransferase
MLSDFIAQLRAGHDLKHESARAAALQLAAAEVPEALKIDFLTALTGKGETADEITAFAGAYRERAMDPGVQEWAPHAIDLVGTGGDHAGGFNISTLAALTLASAGVIVMKHGNGGITSKCGSANLMEALGVDLHATPERSRAALRELGFCFFFAPAYHSVFQHIIPARRALAARGERTVFNMLGPLMNPGRPAFTLLGVFSPALLPKFGRALEVLGTHAGVVAHGRLSEGRGIDEMTTATENLVEGLGSLRGVDVLAEVASANLPRAQFADLVGGDVEANVRLTEAILAGRGPVGLVDTIVLNVAVALWIMRSVPSVRAGVPLARDRLLGGAVAKKIADTRDFYRS